MHHALRRPWLAGLVRGSYTESTSERWSEVRMLHFTQEPRESGTFGAKVPSISGSPPLLPRKLIVCLPLSLALNGWSIHGWGGRINGTFVPLPLSSLFVSKFRFRSVPAEIMQHFRVRGPPPPHTHTRFAPRRDGIRKA